MRKRPLGKTGLVVSELAIGTWGLAGESYGTVDEADAEKVLRRAVDMGFTLIDTADAYGGGRMELLAGKILKDHPELHGMSRIGLWESFRLARLALWDEAAGRLVSFREAGAA